MIHHGDDDWADGTGSGTGGVAAADDLDQKIHEPIHGPLHSTEQDPRGASLAPAAVAVLVAVRRRWRTAAWLAGVLDVPHAAAVALLGELARSGLVSHRPPFARMHGTWLISEAGENWLLAWERQLAAEK